MMLCGFCLLRRRGICNIEAKHGARRDDGHGGGISVFNGLGPEIWFHLRLEYRELDRFGLNRLWILS